MAWLMAKGQDLQVSEPTHAMKELTFRFWLEESRVSTFRLMACDDDQSPSHAKHEVNQRMITVFITNDT
jgi:hypothetical protein